MLLKRIKDETRNFHNNIELVSYSSKIMNCSLSKKEYSFLVSANYIFNYYLEIEIKNFPQIDNHLLKIENREKVPLLLTDLSLLNISQDEILINSNPPILEDVYKALAYMYLSEGSTLGGRFIFKALKNNPNLSHLEDFYFYSGYENDTSSKWKEFCSFIEEYVPEDKYDYFIDSIKDAYKYYEDIFTLVQKNDLAISLV